MLDYLCAVPQVAAEIMQTAVTQGGGSCSGSSTCLSSFLSGHMDSSSLSWKQLISQCSWFRMTSVLLSSVKTRLMLRALNDQFANTEVPDLLSVTDISTPSFLEVFNHSSFLYMSQNYTVYLCGQCVGEIIQLYPGAFILALCLS